MATHFCTYAPDQDLLLPTSLREWLPEDHLACFISDAVDALDLSAFYQRYEGDGRRRAPLPSASNTRINIALRARGGDHMAIRWAGTVTTGLRIRPGGLYHCGVPRLERGQAETRSDQESSAFRHRCRLA